MVFKYLNYSIVLLLLDFFMNLDFLLPNFAHFHNIITLLLLVFETLEVILPVNVLHFKQYDFIFICKYHVYGFKLLLIISLRLITSLIPFFFAFFNQDNFRCIAPLTIHHSNAFFKFSIFFLFINNCHKVFIPNFIIH